MARSHGLVVKAEDSRPIVVSSLPGTKILDGCYVDCYTQHNITLLRPLNDMFCIVDKSGRLKKTTYHNMHLP